MKKCTECDHDLPNVYKKIIVLSILSAALEATSSCAIEFIYIFPADTTDKRKWIGVIICSNTIILCKSLYSHPVNLSLSYKLSTMLTSGIKQSVNDKPCITIRQVPSGQGLEYRPGLADMAGISCERNTEQNV